MTGLEPHPVFKLPTREQMRRLELQVGREQAAKQLDLILQARKRAMELEEADRFQNGYEPAIWHLMDDLLVEGKEVCLVDYPDILPKEFLNAVRAGQASRSQLTLVGRRELLAHGANGASKSEYAAKKVMKVLRGRDDRLAWVYHETERESIDRQQPLFIKYMQPQIKRAVLETGRYKAGAITKVNWTKANGFTDGNFVLPNGSSTLFKNYKQDPSTAEGGQVDIIWCDELVPLALVQTLRFRLMARKGILIVTFTPIKGWTQTVQEYRQGARPVLEVDAERLPIRNDKGELTGYRKVPRVEIAGPGTKGTLKANIVYLHSSDNPFVDKNELDRLLENASENEILQRGYGVATKAFGTRFPKFSEVVHVLPPERIPQGGTNYHIVDPCDGRNWFMIWLRIDERGRRYAYREWPSCGSSDPLKPNRSPSAYIEGIGDPGPWTLPGNSADGDRGPAQDPYGWGLDRYKREILRCEGKRDAEKGSRNVPPKERRSATDLGGPKLAKPWLRTMDALKRGRTVVVMSEQEGETIQERIMDSRFGATPVKETSRQTTLLEQMADIDMEFVPASGKEIDEGVQLINNALDYDDKVPIGEYSGKLSRINEPLLYVSSECPNLIYALREWTGKDGRHGACKDCVDTLRYAFEGDLDFVGGDAYAWHGGGTY